MIPTCYFGRPCTHNYTTTHIAFVLLQVGSPVVIDNNLDFPLEVACLTSLKPPAKPDCHVFPGTKACLPLGLMEVSEREGCA